MPAIIVSASPDLTIAQAVVRFGAGKAVISETPSGAIPGIDSPEACISAWRSRAAWIVELLNSGNTMFMRVL